MLYKINILIYFYQGLIFVIILKIRYAIYLSMDLNFLFLVLFYDVKKIFISNQVEQLADN